MARPRRNSNSNVARLHRVEPFRLADEAKLKDAADRIAGPAGWHDVACWGPPMSTSN